MGLLEFAHVLWKHKTDNRPDRQQFNNSVRRFFYSKAIQAALQNACDYVVQFNFKIAHIARSINTAADFLFRLYLEVTEKESLKIRDDIQTTPIEVTTTSSDVADEEQFFLAQAEDESESEVETLQRKEKSRQEAMERVANQEPSTTRTSVEKYTKIDGNATS